MKTHIILRKLTAGNGSCTLHPIGITTDEAVLKGILDHAKSFIDEIQAGHITVSTPNGPRAVMTVAQLLAELGIADVGVVVMSGEAKESNLVVPRKLVALQ